MFLAYLPAAGGLADAWKQMPRPEAVKRIWAYVKEHGLQDPEDRRYILCDDNMRPVFGDKVHMLYVHLPLSFSLFC